MKRIELRLRLPTVAALSLAAAIGWAVVPAAGQAQHDHVDGQRSAPEIGAAASPFELKTLDGKPLSLTGFRGKPLVLNFFASWCDPCREEMPLINDLAAKAATNDYSVLAVAVEDSRSAVTQYAKESKLTLPIALDLNSTVKRAYRIFGPPATFLLTAKASSATSSSAHSRWNGHRQRSGMPVYEDDSYGPRWIVRICWGSQW